MLGDNLPKTNSTEVKADLLIDIDRITEQKLPEFGVEIQGSRIIRKGRDGSVEGDIGTMEIPDEIFEFSNIKYMSLKYFTPQTKPRKILPHSLLSDDYLELKITYTDGRERIFNFERNPEVSVQEIFDEKK